jgi:hypothetical protein
MLTPPPTDAIPRSYTSELQDMTYEQRPLPRPGERAVVDTMGSSGLIVRDGSVVLGGQGRCGLQLSDNIVAASHIIKLQGDVVLLKGATRLKGSLRSLEQLSEVGLEAKKLHLLGEETLLGASGGKTHLHGNRLYIGRGANTIRLGDLTAGVVIVGSSIEIFGNVVVHGVMEVQGVLTNNGRIAKGHLPGPWAGAPSFPGEVGSLSEDEDPEQNASKSVAAGHLIPA